MHEGKYAYKQPYYVVHPAMIWAIIIQFNVMKYKKILPQFSLI